MNNKFKLFTTKAQSTPGKKAVAVMASLPLHNIVRTKTSESYTPVGFIDTETNDSVIEGTWRKKTPPDLTLLKDTCYGRTSLPYKDERKKACQYFGGPDQVSWQWGILVNLL